MGTMARRSTPRPEDRESGDRSHRNGGRSVDSGTLRTVLQQYPIRLAVLFGSQVVGNADSRSDIDLAIELAPHDDEATTDLYMSILTDLSIALERDDIDLTLVKDLKPRVGLAAFTRGELLIGSAERMRTHRERFERQVEQLDASEPSPGERFDAVLERISDTVGEKP